MKVNRETINKLLSFSKSMKLNSGADISKKINTVHRQQENANLGGIFYNVNIN